MSKTDASENTKELVIDKSRVAEEINAGFQEVLTKVVKELDEKTSLIVTAKESYITKKISEMSGDLRSELLEEIRNGRTVINLSNTRSIAVGELDHPKMEDVVKSINMFKKTMLVGPAGTGKT